MVAETQTRPMTADDLLQMPDDGFRYELVRGELRKMSPAGRLHGRYGGYIHISMGGHVMANDLGETYSSDTGFELAPNHVRMPDASFVRQERIDAMPDEPGYVPGPPDVAVEVISPSDRYTDVEEKVADYLEAGALAVVVVNPRNRTVRVHRSPTGVVSLTESDTLEVDDVIPGWRMPIKDIFRRRMGVE